jgi:hypothetical protein
MVLVVPLGAEPIEPGAGTRPWLGPQVWANPLQDWSVEDGRIVARGGQDRTAHALGFWVTEASLAAPITTRVSVDVAPRTKRAGLRVGIRASIDDHRAALLAQGRGLDAAIDAEGVLHLAQTRQPTPLRPADGPVQLVLQWRPGAAGHTRLELSATDHHGTQATLAQQLPTPGLCGNIALLAESDFQGPTRAATAASRPRVRFADWTIDGERLTRNPEVTFGPILWSQYTLSRGVLTLSAQMPPLGPQDAATVGLEVADAESDRGWREIARRPFDADARVAVFRLADWQASHPVQARLTYRWQGRDSVWPMTIRPEPKAEDPLSLAVMSCDAGYAFPQTPLVAQVIEQDPDLVFFAGDQIYEHFGGFGVARTEPVEFAILDYLRKYLQFGWTWRQLLRDRPSVILPDDHDVFHGNVWGAGGKLLEPGQRPIEGGYLMPVRFVNAVQRTQTSHLPAPHDPTPTPSGIGVYYTAMRLGPVDFAILEDRKWKDGTRMIEGPIYDREALKDASLLGDRQEAFLAEWRGGDAPFKAVLSQTMFAKPATHQGRQLKPQTRDADSNGWPMPARDRALRLLGPDVLMIAGDQHLGMFARLGVDTWDDGPLAFMAPGTANGHPRAWWPDATAAGDDAEPLGYTGRYVDGLGNRLDVLGVANPQPDSHRLRASQTHPYDLARQKGSGYGMLRFDPRRGRITASILRFPTPRRSAAPSEPEPFEGFPITRTPGTDRPRDR